MNKLVIIGAGPHSKVILDIFLKMKKYEVVGLTDPTVEGYVLGYPILGTDEILPDLKKQGIECAFVALGNNKIRKNAFYTAESLGFKMVNAISPKATVSEFAKLSEGIAVMPGAIINACANIGKGVVINTNVSVDHDCQIGAFSHIAPGCAISGSTYIGEETFLGTGSRVIDKIHIGNKVIVGAGSVVIRNLESNCKVVGVPAKIIKKF
ncbi:MAG: acetyltransferase [Phascolarctobacterium sp.]|uniref:acetyltransferase n=1 Tax=Phascolarctobacterium sp. TaxID=2049039 RepID=UPI0026DD630C|nr:acetyltransferase [Phascolarctobacterium sp.]MDO4921257.1 acetyltransferase [Phascolarctobacterium sp.]